MEKYYSATNKLLGEDDDYLGRNSEDLPEAEEDFEDDEIEVTKDFSEMTNDDFYDMPIKTFVERYPDIKFVGVYGYARGMSCYVDKSPEIDCNDTDKGLYLLFNSPSIEMSFDSYRDWFCNGYDVKSGKLTFSDGDCKIVFYTK